MGGMDNKTSLELAKVKTSSLKYHSKENERLYKEYLDSGQHTDSFYSWKKSKKKKKKSQECMQKPLTPKQLKEKGYNTKSLNQSVRWK